METNQKTLRNTMRIKTNSEILLKNLFTVAFNNDIWFLSKPFGFIEIS